MDKTNAVRLVESAGLTFVIKEYEYDESDLSGVTVALKTGIPKEQVFKTLVTRGDKNGINVFCIPVCDELDLKKAAKSVGEKSVELLHVKDIKDVTGYIRGGCTPIGMKKQFRTVIHSSALSFDEIIISGGMLGAQIFIAPEKLRECISANFENIIF